MVERKKIDISRLNDASKYREEFEKLETRVKKQKSKVSFLLAFSVTIMATSLIVASLNVFANKLNLIDNLLPFLGYASLVFGVVFFVWLVSLHAKVFKFENQANEARRIEGVIAQELFKLTL